MKLFLETWIKVYEHCLIIYLNNNTHEQLIQLTVIFYHQRFFAAISVSYTAPPPPPLSANEYVHFFLLRWQTSAGKFSSRSIFNSLVSVQLIGPCIRVI